MSRTTRLVLAVWPLACALAVCAPLLAPGFVLSRDLVFVPDLGLRRDVLGLGTALPRAVPSDAVVAVLDNLTGGMVLEKLVLLAIPAGAGWGMVRLVRAIPSAGSFAALAAATFYVWNPFVAERLVLGHWPLLLAHAALPWLVVAAVRVRRGEVGAWPAFVLASAVCALSASGAVVALLVGLPVVAWPPARFRAVAGVLGVAVAVNAPWWVVGLAGPGTATSDPAAVAAFAARDEGYGGVLPTLLTLGGVWNADVVPDSRGTALAVAGAALLLMLSAAGVVVWWRRQRAVAAPVTVAAVLAVAVALLGAVAPGVLRRLVEDVPGAGLLRDGQRYLDPLVLLEAAGFGLAAARLRAPARRRLPRWSAVTAACGLVLLPVAVLPDLAWGAGLGVASYPSDWAQARRVLAADPRPGDVMPWPFESYRAPAFNGGRPVVDPGPRYLPRPAVVPDELVVGRERLAGEDPRARRVAAALRSGGDATDVLLAEGVGWIFADGAAPPPVTAVRGAREVFRGDTAVLYVLDGPPANPPAVRGMRRVAIAAGWIAAAAACAAALLTLGRAGMRRFDHR